MKGTTIAVALLLAATALPAFAAESGTAADNAQLSSEDAQKSPPHFKVYRGRGRRVVVHHGGPVVVAAAPVVHHHAVVVAHPAPAVVHVHKHERRVVEQHAYVRANRRDEDDLLGVGVRLSGTSVDGQQLNLATVENPTLWGPGLQFRGKMSENVGLELGVDWLSGRADQMNQTTVPLMLSAMYYFVPDGGLRLFGLLGGGVSFTALEYDRGFRHDLVELAGQAGGGIELRLSRDFALTADLRFMGLYRDLGATTTIREDCLHQVGSSTGFCNGLNALDTSDKFNVGAQFMAGATLYF